MHEIEHTHDTCNVISSINIHVTHMIMRYNCISHSDYMNLVLDEFIKNAILLFYNFPR